MIVTNKKKCTQVTLGACKQQKCTRAGCRYVSQIPRLRSVLVHYLICAASTLTASDTLLCLLTGITRDEIMLMMRTAMDNSISEYPFLADFISCFLVFP